MKNLTATIVFLAFLSSCGLSKFDSGESLDHGFMVGTSGWWPACADDPTGGSGNCLGSSEIGNTSTKSSDGKLCGYMDMLVSFSGRTKTTNDPFRAQWFMDSCGNAETGFLVNPDTAKEQVITVPGFVFEIDVR